MAGKNIKLNPEETLGHVEQDRRDDGGSLGARPGTAAPAPASPIDAALNTVAAAAAEKAEASAAALAARGTEHNAESVQAVAAMQAQEEENAAEDHRDPKPGPRSGHHRGLIAHSGRRYGEPMRTLVTGAAGFIGSTLVDRLLADGHAVTGIDDLSSGSSTNLDNAEQHPDFEFVKADIVDADLIGLLADVRPEVIFHLAAQISVSHSVEDPPFDASVNVVGTVRLAEAARRAERPQDRAHLIGRIGIRHTADLPDQRGRPDRSGLAVRGQQGGRRGLPQHLPQSLRPRVLTHRTGQRLRPAPGPARRSRCGRDLLPGAARRQADEDLRRRHRHPRLRFRRRRRRRLRPGVRRQGWRPTLQHRHRRGNLDPATTFGDRSRGRGQPDEPEFHPPRLGDLRRSCLDISRAEKVLGWTPKVGLEDGVAQTVAFFREEQNV